MKRVILIPAALLAFFASVPTAQSPAPSQPAPATQATPPAQPAPPSGRQSQVFRAAVDIVSLNVTVVDGDTHYVTDLELPDFTVFEDGVKQDVTFFNRRQQQIAMSMLLDSSASMEDKLQTLQVAAVNFVKRMKPADLAQIIDFDSSVQIRQGFTSNQGNLESAILQTASGGSTSLHNAIYISLKELQKVRVQSEEDVRRQALIVFSDGEEIGRAHV